MFLFNAGGGDERATRPHQTEIIPVELPYPRSYKIKTTPEFVRLKERLVEEIRAEALKVAVDA